MKTDFSIPLKQIVRCPRCRTAAYLMVGTQHFGQWLLERLRERYESEERDSLVDFQYARCTCGWQGLVIETVISHQEGHDGL